MREDVGPSTPKGNHRKLASGCVFAKILLKITVPCDCFLCRRVSPSNASGSFCLTRSWSLTALSEGPSKTVCALGPSVPRRLPSGLAVRPQGAGALQSRVGLAPYLAHPRRVNFNFCFLGVFSLRGSQGGEASRRGASSRAQILTLFWADGKARQGRWRLTSSNPPALCTWAGQLPAPSLSFPIWVIEMKVLFLVRVLCGFLLVGFFLL